MKLAAFQLAFTVLALAIPAKHGALGNKAISNVGPKDNKSQTKVDVNSRQAKRLTNLEKKVANLTAELAKTVQARRMTTKLKMEVSSLKAQLANAVTAKKLATKLKKEVAKVKAELAKAGKPFGFAMLDRNGSLPHNLLPAGYNKYSAYDLAWQSLHMAAAAACRGGTLFGGHGWYSNKVMIRNMADRKSCNQICASTFYRHCDGEVSIYGRKGRGTKTGMIVGSYYNYRCRWVANGGNEAYSSDETIVNYSYPYFSFCCCRARR